MDFQQQIALLIWGAYTGGASLCIHVGAYQAEVFATRADQGFEGGGYDWGSLVAVYLNEKKPHLAQSVKFNPEGSMFTAYSEQPEALRVFAPGFQAACVDDALIRDLFARAVLD